METHRVVKNEGLSERIEDYERREKFGHYMLLATLREYALEVCRPGETLSVFGRELRVDEVWSSDWLRAPSPLDWRTVEFRDRVLGTLRQLQPVLDEPGVLVAGSEVPNLLQSNAASTLVVSEDVDIAGPVTVHASVKQRLAGLTGFRPAPEEPSVWLPEDPTLIEVKFIGLDRRLKSAAESYVLEDPDLPLLVFGQLSLLHPDVPIVVDGVRVPLPRKAGLMVEKLLTDRSGVKGDRDLLVVAGLMQLAKEEDLAELVQLCSEISDEERHNVRSNLTLLSLLPRSASMPDPLASRALVARVLRSLDEGHR